MWVNCIKKEAWTVGTFRGDLTKEEMLFLRGWDDTKMHIYAGG